MYLHPMLSGFLHVVGVAPGGQQKFTTSGQAFLVIFGQFVS